MTQKKGEKKENNRIEMDALHLHPGVTNSVVYNGGLS